MAGRARRFPLFLLTALLLAACAAQQPAHRPFPAPPPETPAPVPEQPPIAQPQEPAPPEEKAPPPKTAEEISGPAVVALLSRADTQAGAGQLDRAAASVERALDVEPRNPFLYHRLAILRLDQDQPGQAEALASKSNSLAGDNPYLRTRNWEVIAQARYMRGDQLGADNAEARAAYYRGRLPE